MGSEGELSRVRRVDDSQKFNLMSGLKSRKESPPAMLLLLYRVPL